MSESLGEALPREQARVRELIGIYKGLPGGVGAFGVMGMELSLQRADRAVISGDIGEMIAAYQELKGWEE